MSVPEQQDLTPSNLDLTTIANVKDWLDIDQESTDDDSLIQSCITAWGYEFLWRTAIGDPNYDFLQSPFNQVCTFTEVRDGKNNFRMFLKSRPIVTVTSLTLNGVAIPLSTAWNIPGYIVDETGKSIALRGGIYGWGTPMWGYGTGPYTPYTANRGGLSFWKGIGNVTIVYTAGYSTTPFDIVDCANVVVSQNYKRRRWIDEATRAAAAGAGAVRYRDWDVPPAQMQTISHYRRVS